MANRFFLSYQETHQAFLEAKKLKQRLLADPAYPPSWEDLETYHRLTRLEDRAFPMLLRSGESLGLDPDPVHLYLIPPLQDQKKERWILCQAPGGAGTPPRMGLLRWSWSDEGLDRIEALQAWPDGWENLDDIPDYLGDTRLARRALGLELIADPPGMVVLALILPGARLQLVGAANKGIWSHSWTPDPKNNSAEVTERRSSGNMPGLIKRTRHLDSTYWRDDDLGFIESNTQIRGATHHLGHINGADGPKKHPKIAYVAGDKGTIHRIRQGIQEPEQNLYLGGEIEDVLVVSHPSNPEGYAILAAAADGNIYLLEDNNGEGELKTLHYQFTGQGMVRLLGFGGDRILARDRHAQIIPLRLHDPRKIIKLRHELTRALWARLDLGNPDGEIWRDPESVITRRLKEQGFPFAAFARLRLEKYLLTLDPQNPDWKEADKIASGLQKLIKAYHGGYRNNPDTTIKRSELHNEFLDRLWRWISNTILLISRQAQSPISSEFLLSPLLEIAHLPSEAPDWLWLRLFRRAEWLLRLRDLCNTQVGTLAKKIKKILEEVQKKRAQMAPAAYQVRPLRVTGGARTSSPIRHLRRLGDSNVLIYIADGRELVVMNTAGSGSWTEVQRISPAVSQIWKGMPTTLLACPDLTSLFSPRWKQKSVVMMSTDRGEILLFIWNDKELALADNVDIDFNPKCGKVLHDQAGILLGGTTPGGEPALAWLPIDGARLRNNSLRILWRGEPGSSLRKLVIKKRESGRLDIWAVDQLAGRLLHWQPETIWLQPGTKRNWSPAVWYQAGTPLHTLETDGEQLVTGGTDGMAYAFRLKDGVPAWIAGCGNTLRRSVARIIQFDNSTKTRWLLGGDHAHMLITNNKGYSLGAAEGFGPFTTLIAGSNDSEAFLGALDGRLCRLDLSEPKASDTADQIGNCPAEHYPLRNQPGLENLSDTDLAKLLKSPDYPRHESLPILVLYKAALDRLKDKDLSDPLWIALRDRVVSDPAPRLVWLIRYFRKNLGWNALPWVLDLSHIYWEQLPNLADTSNLCQPLNQILSFLEDLRLKPEKVSQHIKPKADELIDKIQNYLWQESDDNNHLGAFFSRRRIEGLRVAQGLRLWPRKTYERPMVRLNAWLTQLIKVWEIDDREALKERIIFFLKANPPNLLPGNVEENTIWWEWFKGLLSSNEAPVPTPLVALLPKSDGTLPTLQDLENAKEAFPNDTWNIWLEELGTALKNLIEARETQSNYLWREWECLTDLQHLFDQGEDRFSLRHHQPLLSMWWPHLRSSWKTILEQRREILIKQGVESSSSYFDIDLAREIWIDDQHLRLELEFLNRLPNELRLHRFLYETAGDNSSREIIFNDGELTLPACADWIAWVTPELEVVQDQETQLTLFCTDRYSGNTLEIRWSFTPTRTLGRFDQDPAWQPTWQYLEEEIRQYQKENKALPLWIDGDLIGQEEFRHLQSALKELFNLDIRKDFSCYKSLEAAFDSWQPGQRCFSPDLALGTNVGHLLEQFHALLHRDRSGRFQYFALGIWRLAHSLPEEFIRPLKELLPDSDDLENFLVALLPGCWSKLKEALKNLPKRALGAWCTGDPIYSSLPPEVDEQEAYFPPVTAFPPETWKLLEQGKVSDETLSRILDIKTETIRKQRQARLFLSPLWEKPKEPIKPEVMSKAAQALFAMLGVSLIPGDAPWVEGTSKKELVILHRRFDRIFFSRPDDIATEETKNLPEGLWLLASQPNEAQIAGLPGAILHLRASDAWRLIHAEQKDIAQNFLDRLAAKQWGVTSELVFKTEGGLSDEGIKHHFAGRSKELSILHQLKRQCDTGTMGAALLVGGRRIGKTSLRQRLSYEIKTDDPKRCSVVLDLQDFPLLEEKDSAIHLQHEFVTSLYSALKKAGAEVPENKRWDKSKRDSKVQAERAIKGLEDHWSIQKKLSGGLTPLLVLDETEKLIYQDARLGWPILSHLRKIAGEGNIFLIMTSYPHGFGHKGSLNALIHQSGSPAYNFLTKVEVGRWDPETTWDYLHRKLKGFGILLPWSFRDQVLTVTQGVPYIVHKLGIEICNTVSQKTTGSLVTPSSWRLAVRRTRKWMRYEFTATIRSMAEQIDKTAGINIDINHETCLDVERLLEALFSLASRCKIEPPQPGESWPETPASFTIQDLSQKLGRTIEKDCLEALLNRLTGTHTLEGDVSDKERFYFAYNLLPSLAHPVGYI